MSKYTIEDDFELYDNEWESDDDDQWLGTGNFLRRRKRKAPVGLFLFLVFLLMGIAAFASLVYIPQRQEQDSFCIGCHTNLANASNTSLIKTNSHTEYVQRAAVASATGELPSDLASFHYQRIRVSGGDIRCIDCHRGDDGWVHRAQTTALSAWMTALWLADREDPRIEKTAITGTVQITNADSTTRTLTLWPNLKPPPGLEIIVANYTSVITLSKRITRTLPLPALHVPVLSNAGCVNCHQANLLIAGADNHFHNMLPAAYALWKNGAKLIPPKALAENPAAVQAIIAQGLTPFNTELQCASCHQTHRSTEARQYLDRQDLLPQACVQCHREVGQGPGVVKFGEEQ